MWEKAMPLGLPGKAFQGDQFYSAENLDPVAIVSYYYGNSYKSIKDNRQKKEKKQVKSEEDATYPSYNELYAEVNEEKPNLIFTIKDASGKVVKKVFKKPSKGLQRFHWNLRYEENSPIDLSSSSFYNPFAGVSEGTLVNPGTYTIELDLYDKGAITNLVSPVSFNVKALDNTVMPAEDRAAKVAFQREVSELLGEMSASGRILSEISNKLKYIKEAVKVVEKPIGPLSNTIRDIELRVKDINTRLYGDSVKRRLDIQQLTSPSSRLGSMVYEQKYSTAAPTLTHVRSFAIAKEEYLPIKVEIENLMKEDIKKLEDELKAVGAPYTPGRIVEEQ